MKKSLAYFCKKLIISSLVCIVILPGCLKKDDNPIKYKSGFFPDSVMNMGDINSQYDDYNVNLNTLTASGPLVFSSNRNSSGGQFDLVQGGVSFVFDQVTGNFTFNTSIINDPFLSALLSKAATPRNDFGPYRFFSAYDGFEYLILSSENTQGNLDFYYLRNRPQFNQSIPAIEGPSPISLLNTGANDAYFCFDGNQDTAYFCSSRTGNFDIFFQPRPNNIDVESWFMQNLAVSSPVDSLNSPGDDKCPHVQSKIMVFASNRQGGLGGFDLYWSIMRKGKWSSPVNFGPGINSSSNEYRPVMGWSQDFTNAFLIFSSDRPGGKGGYDLYFTGIDLTD